MLSDPAQHEDRTMSINVESILKKIAEEPAEVLSQHQLYAMAKEVLKVDNLDPSARRFFNDVRESTRHVVVLGCGHPLNYELLKEDAKGTLESMAKKQVSI